VDGVLRIAATELLLRRIDDVQVDSDFVVCPTHLIRRSSA
jgi:hypothetical protein